MSSFHYKLAFESDLVVSNDAVEYGSRQICKGYDIEIPVYTVSKFGMPVIQIGLYRFNRRTKCKGARAQWVCTKWSSGCRASLFTFIDEIMIISSQCQDVVGQYSKLGDTGITEITEARELDQSGSALKGGRTPPVALPSQWWKTP
ncbi:jg19947 [Pararge aegeria aegeria]|uniref:Jg19947 protein n=1 Tax=Pararge aegeria aegeria TaxID=348720 RepID=A0A8S4RVR5_9NEOP|nr:jg19947 [Pararge aegeria aegeria]